MEYQELNNYGRIFTGKLSAHVLLAVFSSLPRELGFIGTPKFLTKIGGKERQWKGKMVKIAGPMGINHKEFLEGSEYNMAFYSTLVATLGEDRAAEAYSKLTEQLAVLSYEEFFPSAKDFQGCSDYWAALQGYFLGFLRVSDQENLMRFSVVQTDGEELRVHLTRCAIQDMYAEADHRRVVAIICEAHRIFLANLCNDLGGEYRRESKICTGDTVCDWHFLRHKVPR